MSPMDRRLLVHMNWVLLGLAAVLYGLGVLNLYSERVDAFAETERSLLAELGATIGTAMSGLRARQELESQKRRYKRLTERISDAYYAVDDEWTITYWNDQMAARTGRPAAEVVGETLWTAFPAILGSEAEEQYRTAMETNQPQSFEMYVEDPFDYWVEIDVHPDDDGLSVFSREITERKRREAELTRAERRLDAIVHNTSESIYIKRCSHPRPRRSSGRSTTNISTPRASRESPTTTGT